MNVLGIETSCDETAVAVVADGRRVLANLVSSQVRLHRPYGGVVPEIAARQHLQSLAGLTAEALERSGLAWGDLHAVAASYGPGLASALLIGLSAAKALALRLNVPFVGINHMEAHLYSPFLSATAPEFGAVCPLIALLVSGGHTCLVRAEGLGQYRLLGRTLDDAAGEAFDKGAKLLGLDYPGGPVIDRLARAGDAACVAFPRARSLKAADAGGLDPSLCFSFSGLKTALRNYLAAHPAPDARARRDLAAAYQEAIVDALARGVERALPRERARALVVAGGVSLNSRLRRRMRDLVAARDVVLLMPDPAFGGDNAAMVAGLAGMGRGVRGPRAPALDACPNLEFGR